MSDHQCVKFSEVLWVVGRLGAGDKAEVSREGVSVLIGMPQPVLGESCTTCIKDFAIFSSSKIKNKTKLFVNLVSTVEKCIKVVKNKK